MSPNILNTLSFDNRSILDRLPRLTTSDTGAPATNTGNPATKPSPLYSGDNLGILNHEVLAKLNEILRPTGATAVQDLDHDDYSTQKVANRVLGFVGRALNNAKQNGADQAQLQQLVQQTKDGIEKGFAEARDVLEELGILNGHIEQNINHTYDLIQAGLSKLSDIFMSNTAAVTSVYTEQTISADYSRSKSLSLEIETNDGDIVTLTLDTMQASQSLSYNAQDANSPIDYIENSSYSSANFSLSITGELDKYELRAIDKLMHKVDKLAGRFFNGDMQQALERISHLKLDTSELAAYSLNLESTQARQVASAYTTVSNLGDNPAAPTNLYAAGGFLAELDQVRQLPDMHNLFKDAENIIDKLFENAIKVNPEYAHHEKDHHNDHEKIKLDNLLSMISHHMKDDHGHDAKDDDDKGRHSEEHRPSKAA